MNRRSIFTLSTITVLGLAMVPGTTVAQQKSLKEQLVGTWMLVSSDYTAANGTKRQPFGANPKGILIFDAGGRYAVVGGRSGRPRFKSASQPTTEELVAATQDYYAANFGTWSVNEADKTVTERFESALRPNNEGTDVKNSISLAGDELKLSGVVPASGTKIESVYRRAK
jgi:Lipocalin-like domain